MPAAHGTLVKTLKVCPKILIIYAYVYPYQRVKSGLTHEIEVCVIHFCIKTSVI